MTRRIRNRNRQNQKGGGSQDKTTKKHQNSCGIVNYSELQHALGITNSNNDDDDDDKHNDDTNRRLLEDILIQCIYSNLVPSGTKLDQKNKCLIVQPTPAEESSSSSSLSSDYVLCRDVNITQHVPDMIAKLESMYQRGEFVKEKLNLSLKELNDNILHDVENEKYVEQLITLAKEKVMEKNHQGGVGGSGDFDDKMMLDFDDSHDLSQWTGMSAAMSNLKKSRGGRKNITFK